MPRVLPKDTTLGRLAGDEFALFVDGLPADVDNRGPIAHLARSILTEVSRAFQLNEHEVFLTASIGVAFCPRDAENVIDLIRNADAAMYYSKQNGGNTFAFYSPEMNAAAVERLMLKSKLRRALERDELVIRYQPKVDLRNGRIIGAEALLRWRLPGHGDIPPSQFIPLAEETSLILDVGEWVLNRVCRDYRQMQSEVPDPGRISLNLSLKQLRQASFILRCRSVFRRHGVSPTSFELEITETTLMADAARTVRLLDELYAMGLHLSIDDFGTGYSSLVGAAAVSDRHAEDRPVLRTRRERRCGRCDDRAHHHRHGAQPRHGSRRRGSRIDAPSGLPAQAQLSLRTGQNIRRAVHRGRPACAAQAPGRRHAAFRPSAAAGGRALEPQRLTLEPAGNHRLPRHSPRRVLWRLSLTRDRRALVRRRALADAISRCRRVRASQSPWYHGAGGANRLPCRCLSRGCLRPAGVSQTIFDQMLAHRAQRARVHRARLFSLQRSARRTAEAAAAAPRTVQGAAQRAHRAPARRAGTARSVRHRSVNTADGGVPPNDFQMLRAAGVELVVTDRRRLRDASFLCAQLWRFTVGRRPGASPPHLESANHRRTLIADDGRGGLVGIIGSADPRDASSAHSNVAVKVSGPVLAPLLQSELAIARFSGWRGALGGSASLAPQKPATADTRATRVSIATESAIHTSLLAHLNAATRGDAIDIAMFHIADRAVIEALLAANARGARVRLILDPNKTALGESSIPNGPVASELVTASDGAIHVRWYRTHGEEFHSKLVMVRGPTRLWVTLGSADLTRRNLADYDLNANLAIDTAHNSPLGLQISDYFETLWSNRALLGVEYSADFAVYAEPSQARYWLYRLMDWSGIASF